MKKRLIAMVCTLAVALGVCAGALTVDVSAATKTYEVGYARVDINPWEDPYDKDGDGSKGKIMQLPMQGNSDNMQRQSVDTLLDDNGDGVIKSDGSDGLFASCIAVTDDDGDTVLIYSVAMVSGLEKMVKETRKGLQAALKEKNINIKLPSENIQIQGTHTHSSIALGEYKESLKGSTATYKLKDQNGDETTNTITAGEVYENFTVWYPYFLDQLVQAGVKAIEDRATATMSKGQIDAGDTAPKTTAGAKVATNGKLVMNTVRHYTRVTQSNEVYVWGSNFNGNNMNAKTTGDRTTTVDSTGSAELVKANDTMYCLKFEFAAGSGKAPIALVNWRAHTTMANRDGTRLYVSSCYPNRMSYELSKEANGGYRAIFIQGAAGNINTSSKLYGAWCGGNATDTNGNGIYTGNELPGNIYGEVLGQVAAQCLNNNMTAVDAGDIQVTNIIYNADAKSYKDNELAVRAGKTAKTAGVSQFPFVYPAKVSRNVYNAMTDEQKGWYDSYSGGNGTWVDISGTYKGENYVIASKQHITDISQNAKETGTQKVSLTAFMLGDKVAFVTAPGELYDRYNRNLTWENLKGKSQLRVYNTLATSYNEWDNILSKNVGGSYGTPFVMGYANDSVGYFPNSLAYEYCKGSTVAAIGAYESHVSELAQGQGEKIIDIYADMLGSMATGNDTGNELYRQAYCAACEKTVMWECLNSRYNLDLEDPILAAGHYFLDTEEFEVSQQILVDANKTACLDLRGNDLTAYPSRVFNIHGTLNLFDTVGGGVVKGYGSTSSSYGGGTVVVNADGKFCLYSGNLTQGVSDTYKASSGGVIQTSGEFYMYGGSVYGGTATTGYGGTLYVRGEGSAVISGGSIYGGSTGGTGKCVYVASGRDLTLSGDADIEEIRFGGNTAQVFTISGAYTGTTTLRFTAATEKEPGLVIGISDGANLNGADISVVESDLIVKVKGNQLVLAEEGGAQFEDANGNKVEKSLQTAVDACQGTDKVVTLTQDAEVTGITVTEELLLDLNGKQVTGQFTISGAGKLICMDSQTADYKADDGIFTQLPAAMATKSVAAPGYVKYTHDNGAVSFHKIDTSVDYINLRAASAGLYYSSLFMGDTYAAEMVKTFGVALSIQGEPVSENGFADHALYSTFDGSLFEPGNLKEYTSTILVDILSEDYGPIQNRKNGNTMVYGRSYIQLTDGSYVVSAQRQMNLRTVIEYVNATWTKYNEPTRKTVLELYERFPKVLSAWDTDAIEEEYNKSK